MGARLVTHALSPDWAHLTPSARLCLTTMCQTALDQADDTKGLPARLYWAGHGPIALTLFGDDSPGRLRVVRRLVAELVNQGAIEPVEPARRRRQASYLVTPDRWPTKDGKMGTCAPSSPSSPR